MLITYLFTGQTCLIIIDAAVDTPKRSTIFFFDVPTSLQLSIEI